MSESEAIGVESSNQSSFPGPTAFDYLAIKNVLSRYCEALDTKKFELLKKVFTNDCSCDYPFNSDLQGVKAVSEAIQKRYVYVSYLQVRKRALRA